MRTHRILQTACLVFSLTGAAFGVGCGSDEGRGALTNGQGVAGIDPNAPAEDPAAGGTEEQAPAAPAKTAETLPVATTAPAPAPAPTEAPKPVEVPLEEGSFAAGTVLTTNADLNLRDGPGTGFAVLVTMPNGSTVTVVKASGADGWVNVSFNGQEGYAATKYLDK